MCNYRAVLTTLLLIFACGWVSVAAQPIGTWNSYTSQSTVLEIVQDDSGRIWAATEGGVFVVEDGEITESLTPTEGMYRINPRTLSYDNDNDLLWLGYSDGTFESYNPQTGLFRQYTDIARATRYSPRGINRIVNNGADVVIATDFGIVRFDPDREVTLDTYFNLGSFSSGSRVNDVVIEGPRFYVATNEGVATGDASGDDLIVPDSWTNYGENDGFDSSVLELVFYRGSVHALTAGTIKVLNNTEWESVDYFGEAEIQHLDRSYDGDYLIGWNNEQIWIHNPDEGIDSLSVAVTEGLPVNVAALNDARGEIMAGTTNFGLRVKALDDGAHLRTFLPSGPYMNSFSDINVRDGVLASGSNNLRGRRGEGTTQSGYYLLRDNKWHNFNNLTHPALRVKNYHSVFTSANTSEYFFFGSWGGGVAQHHRETDEVTIWDSENSILDGHVPGSSYIVVSGLATDRHEHAWVVSRGNPINPLYRFVPETEEWTVFPRLQGLTSNDLYNKVTVDSHDQIWLTLRSDRDDGRGLAVKRVDGDQIEDGVILRDEAGAGNLPHPRVNTVVQDRRGEVWIGTERGIARFAFPQRMIDGGAGDRQASLLINADETADSPYLLRTSNVTSIAVNSANQKWVGTDGEGLWLIEEEGGRHRAVKNLTTGNSPLISNTITSLAYDAETGQIFIATDLGLISYTDVVRGSVAEMDELFIYPNPFSYNNEDTERVVIDRLSDQTTIRILTVDGRLVRRLDTRGGRVEWDVRDFKGDRVATGVYIVVSVDNQNDQRGVGKVVVVR